MEVTVLEENKGKGAKYRKEREYFFSRKFNTYCIGLNKQKLDGVGPVDNRPSTY